MENVYDVYVKTDVRGRIVAVNSNEFITDLAGWMKVDSGSGDKYHHAQNNYLEKPKYTDEGVFRYKLIDGVVIERTSEEISADIVALPQYATEEDYVAALESLGVTFDE